MDGITQCFCQSRVRRKFIDAPPKNIEGPDTTMPVQTIRAINKLFKIEHSLENELGDKYKKERLKQAKPEVEALGYYLIIKMD